MLKFLKRYINKLKILALLNVGLLFYLDWLTKKAAVFNLIYNKSNNIISISIYKLTVGINFYLTYNRGTAFSIIKKASSQTSLLLIVCSLLICLILLYLLYRENNKNKPEILAISFILGGAVGNIYDRISYGYVVDFIDLYANRYHWPIFNIADMAISFGVIILAYRIFIVKNKEPQEGLYNHLGSAGRRPKK